MASKVEEARDKYDDALVESRWVSEHIGRFEGAAAAANVERAWDALIAAVREEERSQRPLWDAMEPRDTPCLRDQCDHASFSECKAYIRRSLYRQISRENPGG